MLQRLGWVVGLNHKNKRLLSEDQPPKPKSMLNDVVHEVAIYIHRFHNLDLFEQGWYRIKITMRWEDGEDSYPAIPARVVQYEAPDVAADNIYRVWMIDDTDNSFSTPPFRIRYTRQDVFLSIMISFYLSFGGYEGKSSAVILKFELMHSPTSEIGPELQNSLDSCFASVHEYRIPPKALLGLHSYCPVYFDSFHAVLVDASFHISLRTGYSRPQLKVPSDSWDSGSTYGEEDNVGSNKYSNQVVLLKALLSARDILLEDLRRISKGIDQAIDLTGITFKPDVTKSFHSSSPSLQLPDSPPKYAYLVNCLILTAESLQPLSWDDMLNSFQSVGSQLLYLWNTFLKFHRENTTKVIEFLRNSWANDRRTECSIWMVCSKVEMPHQYISNRVEGTSLYRGLRGRSSSTRRSIDDPVQTAIMRAELQRRGIAQMKINNRSLQDMHIFEDTLRAPIVIVEHLENMYRCSSVNSYFSPLEEKGRYVMENGFRAINKLSGGSLLQNGRVLRLVVFVHGFQGHHLDLRLIRNQWLLIDPKIQFLMSESNEDKTSEDFREMGFRLAQEVISFLKRKTDKASRNGTLKDIKLSFVGHSIGNLIIRSALADRIMEPYLKYLYTYVSISGPHLGYMYSSNTIFNSGMWLWKKIKGPQCIHQLTFTDDLDLENTFIYHLSKKNTMENFRNVILLSSPQDGYVPYHSARIELCPAASLDFSKQGKVFLKMLNNCLDQLRTHSDHRVIMRCDVNFETSSHGRSLNTLLGRAAHIEFLECDIFVKFIMWSFPELFI
ncbi:PREDICTED: protein FAM135B-like isoform X3 [Lupinus angustifolius]|uniref:protein FAM135B-like isoform X3 n=1 Tax=Lupinus angustifolius TaxID=3871 RepID=UPI00092EAC7E|nr:PREDICTED: protein FAM135B-like isoform X3 [Lupinus angustifolius]